MRKFISPLLLLTSVSLLAQNPAEYQILLDPAPEQNDRVGFAIEQFGDRLVIGAKEIPNIFLEGFDNDGKLIIFDKSPENSWDLDAVWHFGNYNNPTDFGEVIALQEEEIICGAPLEDYVDDIAETPGRVHVFRKNEAGNWIINQSIYSPDPNHNEAFGTSISLNNNLCYIGAIRDVIEEEGSQRHGSVMVYEKLENNEWTFKNKISTTNVSQGDLFGGGIVAENNRLFISAPHRDAQVEGDIKESVGAVFYYEKNDDNQWEEKQMITPPTFLEQGYFGVKLYAFNDMLFIASHGDKTDSNNENILDGAGAVYIYKQNNDDSWEFHQKIVAEHRAEGANFGIDINYTDEYLLIGAPSDPYDTNGENAIEDAGAAYLYHINDNDLFVFDKKFCEPERKEEGFYGQSVHMNLEEMMVGAIGYDYTTPNAEVTEHRAGAVYTYNKKIALTVENQETLFLSSYPNPSIDHVTIPLPKHYTGLHTKLYDIEGRLVEQKRIGESSEIHYPLQQESGLYFLDIYQQGQKLHQVKILVQ